MRDLYLALTAPDPSDSDTLMAAVVNAMERGDSAVSQEQQRRDGLAQSQVRGCVDAHLILN